MNWPSLWEWQSTFSSSWLWVRPHRHRHSSRLPNPRRPRSARRLLRLRSSWVLQRHEDGSSVIFHFTFFFLKIICFISSLLHEVLYFYEPISEWIYLLLMWRERVGYLKIALFVSRFSSAQFPISLVQIRFLICEWVSTFSPFLTIIRAPNRSSILIILNLNLPESHLFRSGPLISR